MTDASATERRLRDRIEELEEQIIQLKELLAPRGVTWPHEWRLNKGETALLSSLYSAPSGYRSREALLMAIALYPDRLPSDTLVGVRVCYLKQKVPHLRKEIKTVWARGYELTPAGIAFLRAHVRGVEQRAA